MKRRTFIRNTSKATLALTLSPMLSFDLNNIPEEELLGQGNPTLHGDGYLLREEAHKSFLQMKAAAAEKGIAIKVVSSYRNYAHQNRIWERKYKRYIAQGLSPKATLQKIIEYSTIPGTSRHHWGTDLDIIDDNQTTSGDVLVPSKFHGDGPFCKLKEWMDEHAETYGFYLVYTDKEGRKGFKYEPWHYSYKPLSKQYLESYRELDIKKRLQEENLMGSEHFTEDFINSYISENILDINPALIS